MKAGKQTEHDGASTAPEPANGEVVPSFHAIAEAHSVIRRLLRIVDEEARNGGLDPLEHKILIQVVGAEEPPSVKDVAARLDIPAPLASRMVKALEHRGLITRSPRSDDRRSSALHVSPEAVRQLVQIHLEVDRHVDYFQSHLSEDQRRDALRVFGLFLGVELEDVVAAAAARRNRGRGAAIS